MKKKLAAALASSQSGEFLRLVDSAVKSLRPKNYLAHGFGQLTPLRNLLAAPSASIELPKTTEPSEEQRAVLKHPIYKMLCADRQFDSALHTLRKGLRRRGQADEPLIVSELKFVELFARYADVYLSAAAANWKPAQASKRTRDAADR